MFIKLFESLLCFNFMYNVHILRNFMRSNRLYWPRMI